MEKYFKCKVNILVAPDDTAKAFTTTDTIYVDAEDVDGARKKVIAQFTGDDEVTLQEITSIEEGHRPLNLFKNLGLDISKELEGN